MSEFWVNGPGQVSEAGMQRASRMDAADSADAGGPGVGMKLFRTASDKPIRVLHMHARALTMGSCASVLVLEGARA